MSLFKRFVPFKKELQVYLEQTKKAFDETHNHVVSRRITGFLRDFDNQR